MTRLISDWLVGINVSKFLEPRGLRASSGGVSLRLSELWLHPSTIVFHVGSVHSVTVLHHPGPTHGHMDTWTHSRSCALLWFVCFEHEISRNMALDHKPVLFEGCSS